MSGMMATIIIALGADSASLFGMCFLDSLQTKTSHLFILYNLLEELIDQASRTVSKTPEKQIKSGQTWQICYFNIKIHSIIGE